MRNRREIDGLRCVAVVPVIGFHAGFAGFSGGYLGVDVFFVISGYLITSLLAEDLEAGRFSLARFYERRARRILPALLTVVLCCIPFAWALMTPEVFVTFARSVAAVGLFVSNVFFWRESGYFGIAAEESPLLHTWSLAVEEQFYILFPVLLALLWRFGRTVTLAAIVVMALASLGLSEWTARSAPMAGFFLAPPRFWELMAGGLCAFVLRGATPRGREAPAALGLVALIASMALFDRETPHPSLLTLAPVLATVALILFAGPSTRTGRLLALPLPVGVGLISYSAYLWHQPLFAFARLRDPRPPSVALMLGLCVVTLGLAWLSWRLVEQPFRSRQGGRPRLIPSRPSLLGTAAATCVGLVALGLAGQRDNGLDWRMDADFFARDAELAAAQEAWFGAVRQGECFIHSNGSLAGFREGLTHWNCGPETMAGDVTLPGVAVFGDSKAADLTASLAVSGYAVLSLTGPGCPLRPEERYQNCKLALDRFHAEAAARGIDTVILANEYHPRELTKVNLAKVIDYWTSRYRHVVLLSPMPEFARFAYLFRTYGRDYAATLSPDPELDLLFREVILTVAGRDRVEIVNGFEVFCGSRTGCPPVWDGKLLYVDDRHFSPEGIRLFGRNFVDLHGALLTGLDHPGALEQARSETVH